jgi:ABC-2 type transport system permease protein
MGRAELQKHNALREEIHKEIRQQWEKLDSLNPHSAAHYGSYAIKPQGMLSFFDEGVNGVTGNIIRLEGHAQNETNYALHSQSLFISRFGKLKPKIILQYLVPLFLILLTYALISSERNPSRAGLLLVQLKNPKLLGFWHTLSLWLFSMLFPMAGLLFPLLFNYGDPVPIANIIALWVVYSLFYFILIAFTVVLTVGPKKTEIGLTASLGIWIFWSFFLPKIWANEAELKYPLPSRQDFTKNMEEDRSKGIDGHNPSDEREKELEKETLKKYGVDSLSQLPVNFDGIVMQADEEYGNIVWDKHFGGLDSTIQLQNNFYAQSAYLDPFTGLQILSMHYCGSDMNHHIDFTRASEKYRRNLIKTLNDYMAFGGSKTGDWSWKADNHFFRSIPDFNYREPNYHLLFHPSSKALLPYFIWVVLMFAFLFLIPFKYRER